MSPPPASGATQADNGLLNAAVFAEPAEDLVCRHVDRSPTVADNAHIRTILRPRLQGLVGAFDSSWHLAQL